MTTRMTVAILVFCFGAFAQAADEKASEFVICKSSKAVRTLSVTPDSKNGSATCKVTYTKAGIAETVGEHTNKASCHSIFDHVRESLQDSKWNCRNVSASITTSPEVSKQ